MFLFYKIKKKVQFKYLNIEMSQQKYSKKLFKNVSTKIQKYANECPAGERRAKLNNIFFSPVFGNVN